MNARGVVSRLEKARALPTPLIILGREKHPAKILLTTFTFCSSCSSARPFFL